MAHTTAPQIATPQAQADAAGPLSLLQRLIGVIVSPTPTFEAVVARPTWLGVTLVTSLLIALAWFGFLSTDIGQQAQIDKQLLDAERWGATITPAIEERTIAQAPMMRFIIPGATLIVGPIFLVIITGIIHVIFSAILGGERTFKQALAVVAHSNVIPALTTFFVLPLNYAQESLGSRTNLGVFLPMLEEGGMLARFFGTIDLIWIWYLVVLAIGLGVLYRRKARSIAWTLLGLYLVIALIIAGAQSALGGS